MAKITKSSDVTAPTDNGTSEPVGNVDSTSVSANIGNVGNTDNGGVNHEGSTSNDGSFEFVNEQPAKRGRGRPRKDANTQTSKATPKASKKSKVSDPEKAAILLIEKFEMFTSLALNKDTALDNGERYFIQPSLASMLADMDFDAVDKYAKIMNPLVLLVGLGMWYMRVMPKPTPKINKIKVENDNKDIPTTEGNTTVSTVPTEDRTDNPFRTSILH